MSVIKTAVALWLGLCCIALGVPAVLEHLITVTPNTLLAQADAGRFESAATSAGGFLARSVTTLQTSRGSFSIHGALSLQRGQRLAITDTLKRGTRLCVVTTPPVCSALAGPFAGPLVPVPHHTPRFAWLVTTVGANGVAVAFLFGMLLAFVSGIVIAAWVAADDDAPDNASDDPPEDTAS